MIFHFQKVLKHQTLRGHVFPHQPNTPSMETTYGPPHKPVNIPEATVSKIISEVLAAKPEAGGESQGAPMSFAKETRDLLIECCVEFITMLTSEANDIAEKDAKKTIACEHITKALQDLGFGEYVPELLSVADNFKSSQAVSQEK